VIKGVFAVLVVGGGGLWVLLNPTRDLRRSARPWMAITLSLAAMLVTARAYDVAYTRVTGHGFWAAYWARQVGPMSFASPTAHAGMVLQHLGFYAAHVAWLSAPWGIALIWLAWRWWRPSSRRGGARADPLTPAERRGYAFVLVFSAAAALALSSPSRFAERYAFSVTFLIATAGIVGLVRQWDAFRARLERVDAAIPALPALVWTVLVVGRIVIGP
jgi:hypothetical protein